MYRGNRKHSAGRRRFGETKKKPFVTNKNISNKFTNDPGKRLSESAVGITEYISDLPGFSGIIKARYSDFHVNEIDLSGAITKLTDIESPPTPPQCSQNSSNANQLEDDVNNPHKYDIEILPLETWKEIEEIIKSDDKRIVKVDACLITKEDRTKIYGAVKQKFGSAVVGSTLNEADKKYITFAKFNKSVRIDNREKWLWPGEWVHFLLHKFNLDTMQAAAELAQGLQMKPGNITYAGTKDRRGKTTQWFCVKKVQPRRLLTACKFAKNIAIGNFTFKDHALKLGQLKGNRFRIVLRNIVGDIEVIDKALESLKNNGFINYYGLQRFGSCVEVPTYAIGLALLKSNWKEAIDLILQPRQDESDYQMQLARKEWMETRNPITALNELCRHKSTVEYKLLFGLSKCNKNDYVTALEYIPRNMRLLYLHSYQSFVWNKLVSRRVREGGLKPLVGDLVFINDKEIEEVTDDLLSIIEENDLGEPSQNEKIENNDKIEKDQKLQVRALTKDDIDSGQFSIFDVVMPLPGFDVLYPNNELAIWYKDMLVEDGLSIDSMRNKVKCYSLSGSYRKIISKPESIVWEVAFYDDPNENLILSDLEELKGEKIAKKNNGKYKALLLDFCLNSSTYATMALRELLKGDTSSESQAKLNCYHTSIENNDLQVTKEIPEEKHEPSASKRENEDVGDEIASKKLKSE